MKQILILRCLGIILVVVLIVNITIVVAAPFYMTDSDATRLVSQPDTTRSQNQRISRRPAPGNDAVDSSETDATNSVPVGHVNVAPDESADVFPPDARPLESGPFEPSEYDLPSEDALTEEVPTEFIKSSAADDIASLTEDPAPSDPQSDSTTHESKVPEDALFAIGERISRIQNPQTMVTRQVANAAKQVTRWQVRTSQNETPIEPDNESDDGPHTAPVIPTEDPADILDSLVDENSNETSDASILDEPETSSQIILKNPTAYPVAFELSGRVVRLKPGAELLEVNDELLLRFDRGGDFGVFRTSLSTGIYEFSVTKDGWSISEQAVFLR